MANDPRLERYLTSLESALKPFPVSDRAEIITEIKSHVFSALERDPQAHLDGVLAALGEPETVANRYLLERGMKPAKTSISPIVKWMVIGFLGTVAMVLLFAGFLLTRFHSILKVDGDKGHVEILNGLIDIDGGDGGNGVGPSFTGNADVVAGQNVSVKFTSGRVLIKSTGNPQLSWTCRGHGPLPNVATANGATTLDLSGVKPTRCEVEVPQGTHLAIEGQSGKITLSEPQFDVDAKLASGKVEFGKNDDVPYKFDVAVERGKADAFTSSNSPDARSIRIRVGSGKIENEE